MKMKIRVVPILESFRYNYWK